MSRLSKLRIRDTLDVYSVITTFLTCHNTEFAGKHSPIRWVCINWNFTLISTERFTWQVRHVFSSIPQPDLWYLSGVQESYGNNERFWCPQYATSLGRICHTPVPVYTFWMKNPTLVPHSLLRIHYEIWLLSTGKSCRMVNISYDTCMYALLAMFFVRQR